MDEYIIIFKFRNCQLECEFKNENHFLEHKTKIESVIVDKLKKGKTIPDIVEYCVGLLISIQKEWGTLDSAGCGRDRAHELKDAIVVLKKLKFKFPLKYNYECCWFLKPPKRRTFRPCVMCQVETKMKCSCCRQVYYCSVECQKKGWIEHKATYIYDTPCH